MRIKSSYNLRKIAGENLVIMNSEVGLDTTKVIALNDSAAWLWSALEGVDFTAESAVELLVANFDVEREQAQRDVERWITVLKESNICD